MINGISMRWMWLVAVMASTLMAGCGESTQQEDPLADVSVIADSEPSPYQCPQADAVGTVGRFGEPGTELHADPQIDINLSGENSTDPDGTELTYRWEIVERPKFSRTFLDPGDDVVDPQFYLDVPGDYRVELTVYDEHGLAACEPAVVEVTANVRPGS